MGRRKTAPRRNILPDPLFESELVAKFINIVMRDGKKSIAERVVYGALERIAKDENAGDKGSEAGDKGSKGGRTGGSAGGIRADARARAAALKVFEKAIENISPTVEVKSRRVGGSNYQVPVEVRPERRTALAMRWLVDYANDRGEKTMVIRLANEIMDAKHERGGAVKKREDVHRMAKANQAYSHYRW